MIIHTGTDKFYLSEAIVTFFALLLSNKTAVIIITATLHNADENSTRVEFVASSLVVPTSEQLFS
jgi:hypothetical protein